MLKKYKIMKSKTFIISSYIILIFVIGISIGFSAFFNELNIKGISAIIKVSADIRVTSVYQDETYSDAYSTSLDYNVSNINGMITLPNEDSYVDYIVKITNVGNVEMGIKEITLDNENLDYEISNYTLGDKVCSDESSECTLGAEKNVMVRIKWKTDKYDANNINNHFILNFDFQNYHKVIIDESIKSYIINCPEEVLNSSNLTFQYTGSKFDGRIYMNGQKIYDYKIVDDTITVENVTGEIIIQYISYNIENGSFEIPVLASGSYKSIDAYLVDSWNTTSIADKVEIARIYNNESPHLNIAVDTSTIDSQLPDGNQFAEINASEKATLYQNISVTPGETYNWNIYHRGRSGQEVMALIIGNKQENDPIKINKDTDDQFNIMVDWLFEQNDMDLKVPTKKEKYTIYSPPFNSEGGFTETNDLFSYNLDEIHTEEWNIWLISSLNTNWFSYSDSYTANSNEIIFSLCSIISANSGNLSYGNLIDNASFKNNDVEKLVNGSFEDVTTDAIYYHFNAENSSKPDEGIGWSSTSTDKKVEIGNFEKGKASYNISKDYVSYSAYVKDGINFIELNADETNSIYQNFLTEKGKTNKWSVTHRGRDGIDYMAMIIGPSQSHNPSKLNKNSNDQFMKMVEWMKNNIDITTYGLDVANEQTGCSDKIIIYSSKFLSLGSFEVDDLQAFSLTKDSVHTEEWNVWIMGTGNGNWYTYGHYDNQINYDNTYTNNNEYAETTIAFTNYSTWGSRNNDSKGNTKGNLLDYILWK